MAPEKENMQINTSSPITNQVKKYTQELGTMNPRAIGKGLEKGIRSLSSSLGISKYEKEDMQTNVSLPPFVNQVMNQSQTTEKGSSNPTKLKVPFYNIQTVGTNSNLFSRHLGKVVHDHNICPLGVSSWNDIKQEKLNHMWAAIEHKFESVDMNDNRDHILRWMNDFWNKWKGHLHAKYVKDKSIQQSLKNVPRGVDKKEWEWLVKEHFASESFQARKTRNAANRAKLKMFHHIGRKDGNPPDLATIFFETRKKDNKLVEPETQLEEMVQAYPSLTTIEIVEKCCGPQTRSHIYGFWGGLKAKDLRGGTSSKAELLSTLRSTQEDIKSLNEENKSLNEENKSLNNHLSTLEDEMKEVMKMKELFVAHQSRAAATTSSFSTE
ncbi:hypothetical protein KY290_010817 [Solanum tuberosum]|uniref:Transposon protein, CACTA, En/Spm sub-class n=1 Tax=Solanum tuberosum TaxID=4113 RepID=A0ABQ7VYW3_SOLTU|nr:hypothetical protein KY290_010817 [Solanum tuberosum]